MLDTIATGAELAFSVADKLGAPLLARRRRRALLRLVYFEACADLELFGAFRPGCLSDLERDDPAARWMAASIRTDAMKAVLLGDSEAYRAIHEAAANFGHPDDEEVHDFTPSNLHQALKYVVVKTEALRALIDAPECAALSEPKAGLRLSRIRQALVAVVDCLRKAKELRRFGRG